MKTSVNLSAFRQAFALMNREANFSYEAQEVLFDYLESYEEGTGEEIEMDVIALCCDYQESTYSEVVECYGLDVTDLEEEEIQELVQDFLSDNTSLCGYTATTVVFASF